MRCGGGPIRGLDRLVFLGIGKQLLSFSLANRKEMDHRSSLAEEISKGLPPEDGASGGYEHEFVGEVEDEYKCCICLEVMRDPYQIVPCGHRCCKSCLGILLRFNIYISQLKFSSQLSFKSAIF